MERGRPTGRAVTGVNGAVAAALVIVVAAVALVVNPPSPPGLAEFAPQAAKPITRAPQGQSAQGGTPGGGCAADQGCGPRGESATPVALPTASRGAGVPSALQCYRWPDGSVTQTFDPQSPPCIASWPDAAKGNGGATSPGVTGTSIRVAVPQPDGGTAAADLRPLAAFLNSHFQLYGRQIQLVPFVSQQLRPENNLANPSAQRADARQAASQHVFAALDFVYPLQSVWTLPEYLNTLASERVLALTGGDLPPLVHSGVLEAHAPFQWSYLPSVDATLQATAELTCRQLVGRPAQHAPTYLTTRRKFAVVIPDTDITGEPLPGLDRFLATLAACGVPSPRVVRYRNDDFSNPARITQSFVELQADGVTSLLFFPYYNGPVPATPQKIASNIGYHPEWVMVGVGPVFAASAGASADQAPSTFGVAVWNKLQPLSREPWHVAYVAAGGSASRAATLAAGSAVYRQLQLLAAGVQMAGPRLTPQTFAAALRRTQFANPGARRAPSFQAQVGFTADATMVDDFAGFWLDPANADAPSSVTPFHPWQSFCYVDRGVRWPATGWPATDRFRTGGCR